MSCGNLSAGVGPGGSGMSMQLSSRLMWMNRAGRMARVRVESVNPFAELHRFPRKRTKTGDRVLVVMPMSGIATALVQDLVVSFYRDFSVDVLQWTNARDIPIECGAFGFEDMIDTIVGTIDADARRTHLVALCQAAVPSLIGVAQRSNSQEQASLASLTLIGGPIDPSSYPSPLSRSLTTTPTLWLDMFAIETIGHPARGVGRRVYPAAIHLPRIMTYVRRQMNEGGPLRRMILSECGTDDTKPSFLELLKDLKDIPAEVFLESVIHIYQSRILRDDEAHFKGARLDLSGMRNLPILTVEGDADDIVAPGQTAAVHAAVPRSAATLRETIVIPDAGHFDLIHGNICRDIAAPGVLSFLQRARQPEPQRRQRAAQPKRDRLGKRQSDYLAAYVNPT